MLLLAVVLLLMQVQCSWRLLQLHRVAMPLYHPTAAGVQPAAVPWPQQLHALLQQQLPNSPFAAAAPRPDWQPVLQVTLPCRVLSAVLGPTPPFHSCCPADGLEAPLHWKPCTLK